MNRDRNWNAPSLAVCAVFLLLGCGQAPGSFIILQSQAPTDGCGATADVTAAYVGDGRLDVSIVQPNFDTAYELFPLLENDLPGLTAGQTLDGNRIALTGFDVELTALGDLSDVPATAALFNFDGQDAFHRALLKFNVPWSGTVDSGGGHTATRVRAFQPELATQLRTAGELTGTRTITVDIGVRARGTTLNSSLVSDPFHFPISVCSGCLQNNLGACPLRTLPANPGNPCNPAQDSVIDCCTVNGVLACPALVSQ